ncbi:MAG: SemiSWEET family sugar transporter [Sphingorhabdus sp.]
MNQTIITVIGSMAAILSVISFTPQAWRIIRTRETKGLSIPTYAITALGFSLWSTYGILKGDWPIIVPNLLCLILVLFILMMLILPPKKRDEIADTLDPAAD